MHRFVILLVLGLLVTLGLGYTLRTTSGSFVGVAWALHGDDEEDDGDEAEDPLPSAATPLDDPVFDSERISSVGIGPTEVAVTSFEEPPSIEPGERLALTGRAEPNETVVVTVRSEPQVYTTTADASGDWSLGVWWIFGGIVLALGALAWFSLRRYAKPTV